MSEDTRTPAEKRADTIAAKKAAEEASESVEADNARITSEVGDEVGIGDDATAEGEGAPESGPIVGTEPEEPSDGKVVVVLAHPITKDQDKISLGLETTEKCNVHDEVRVTPSNAQRLIQAGLAQVDPEDAQAVAQVLTGGR